MIKNLPFGNVYGFGNNRSVRRLGRRFIIIESYYSQGMRKSMFGITPAYSVVKQKDSADISGLGNIKYFAQANTSSILLYAQDDAGKIYVEATPGQLDFGVAVRTPGGNGAGLIGDQKARLLYGSGASNNQIGKYDGTTWTDAWLTVTSAQHPMELYEDLVLIANKNAVAVLFSDDTFNGAAFTLPTNVTVAAICAGHKSILIGANLNYEGILILWDGNAIRSIAPWLWTNGKVLAIDRYKSEWIVITEKEIILTNGYTAQVLFEFLDDPFGFSIYTLNPQGALVVNDKIILLQQQQGTARQNSEWGRMKPGVYIFDIPVRTWEYCPISTMNTINVNPMSAFLTKSYSRSLVLGYRDETLNKAYIGTLVTSGPSQAVYISEKVGSGPSEKVLQHVVLNFGISTEKTDVQTLTFDVSVKVYEFKRQLWGKQVSNAIGTTTTIRVDGTDATKFPAQKGDEVTVLEGVNAGKIRHILSIANGGFSNETWTLDVALPNASENGMNLNVQPFRLLQRKSFTAQSKLTDVYFDAKDKPSGKKFLVKVVIENMTSVQPEMHDPVLVYDDLGYTSK